MKKKKLYLISLFFILILLLIICIILIRAFSPTEIDDVTPGIKCPELKTYNPDVLWIIPKFKGEPISENKTWCNEILALNKTLGIHGIEHSYKEFNGNITQKNLDEAILIFEECFGFSPALFKPPQLALSKQNKKLLEKNGFTIKKDFNQLTHKVYHCEDTGKSPNWLINII